MPGHSAELTNIAGLARGRGTEPAFLEPHQIEAARRIRMLFERSQLRQRITMNYGPRISGGRPSNGISDLASDARDRLSRLTRQLPSECAGVVIDVCGYELGLQAIELNRGWPRRSAKLVLRIGLEMVADGLGLNARACGRARGPSRHWMDAKPTDTD